MYGISQHVQRRRRSSQRRGVIGSGLRRNISNLPTELQRMVVGQYRRGLQQRWRSTQPVGSSYLRNLRESANRGRLRRYVRRVLS